MSYSLTKRLPSCLVERKLLVELEGYLQGKLKDFAPRRDGSEPLEYSFVIVDSSGIETLKSVEDFKRTYFPDDVYRISLKCGARFRHNISIEITFHSFQQMSELAIWFNGNSAREVANGIASEIFSILESYKTANRFFHYYYYVPAVAVAAPALIIPASIYVNRLPPFNQSFLATTVLLSFLGSLMGLIAVNMIRAYKPYSTFETRRNERRKRQFNWLVLGLVGFILFTVIGVYFRQKLFGF